ncbi:Ig-like domain-containing protein [Microbacterium suwonense]|uniref:Fibronectin type III n=1 Tax=Microbacterium suwonense TaxID=683047 RepID=A0ABM8FVD9_9MICO|nr:Ig-like domain-containing protein [Microbacterium suwonense]BDZ39637.1 fibronectin type III [Microbacterium suwonense]
MAITTLALVYPGVPTADLDLDDGGVWVTNSDDLLVGHLNHPSRLLDAAVRTTFADFDVLQDGEHVLVLDRAGGTASPVDPATATLIGEQALPERSSIALGADTIAVAGGGLLHAVDFDGLIGASFDKDGALAEVGTDAVVAVSFDGSRVVAASATEKTLITADAHGDDVRTTSLKELSDEAELQVATIGDRAVVFDSTAGVLYADGGIRIDVEGAKGAELQQSSAQNDAVYLASKTGLIRQPLDGGTAQKVADVPGAAPSAPVWLNGCAYAIWDDGRYVRDCDDGAADAEVRIELSGDATPVLRVNRRVVVVNDTRSGTVWVVNEKAERVDNWKDVLPQTSDDQDEQESEDERPQFDIPERSAENHPPVAVDDSYGIRPGRTTILRVTENDSDPDGDLLAASLKGAAPAGFDISPVLGGAGLQVSIPANAQGTQTFRYQVDDGRSGTAEATVKLTVRASDDNDPPKQDRPRTLQVEAGSTVTYPALEGWQDPDGDDIFLSGARVDGGDVISYRPNGVIEYNAASRVLGIKEVTLTVSDGRKTADGVLRVDVRAKGSLNPVANADRVSATAGRPLLVRPLGNDVSPSGESLRLTRVDQTAGVRVALDVTTDSFEFEAKSAGVYYVQYMVTAGPRSAVGIVRVDVVPDEEGGAAPIAARDTALLPTGRSVLVDVLANDEDPSGGILVVQSARVQAGSGISIEVLDHSILRIADVAGLSSPVVLDYTVSNGSRSAIGQVVVVPVPLTDSLRPPVAVDDTATVRVGDVVTVSVLENDYHPDNDVITLEPKLVEENVGDGIVFVDGDRIRLQAGSEPGMAYVTYEVSDSQGNKDAGYVKVQVLPEDAAANSAPRPKPVISRVISGSTVRIPVPLEGIDPDGDSVEIIGLGSNPTLGTVEVGDSWLTYRAYDDAAGRDTFTYVVRDRLGATATNTVTVGIAPPGVDNQAPYAVKDVLRVRPGREVAVPVTVNDTDPDGDDIAIVTDGLTVPEGISASVIGGRVSFTAPREEGEWTITYTISDTFGATAQGVLLVVVDEDALLLAPVARDDRVQLASLTGSMVKVSVLENDEDPDGTVEALDVQVFDAAASVRAGGVVEIPVEASPQIVRYSVTDADGGVGQAFIFVPGIDRMLPTLKSADPVVVTSGETVQIRLADHVLVREGRSPRVALADSIRTAHSDGAPPLKSADVFEYTSAEGYYGPDSIGAQITDGTGPDDPEARTAYVSIPITVLPAVNQSPLVRSASVEVAPGEGAVTVNLLKLTRDPDEGDLKRIRYSVEGAVPAGYSASISGDTLSIKADADVEPGSSEQVTIKADDQSSEPGTGVITITAVASQRPLPVANDDAVPNATAGAAVTVNVLANDFNPYQGERPLEVLSARVDTAGAHEARVQGDKVVVTPAPDFHGTLIVTYRIADATKAADRQAEAKITLTVRGRPDAPGTPTVTSVQDRTVVLSWAPPANNGSPITGYEVRSQDGYAKACASTTCTLGGLTNDVTYRFQVLAVNGVGTSDPSPLSAEARPDARPDTPAPPTLAFGDGELTVTWVTPHTNGSPVLDYDLEISPAPLFGPNQKTKVAGNSLVWKGLKNSQAYQVKVRAYNRALEPSEWSGKSASMIPAGKPDAPGRPQTSPATPVGDQAQITVSWAPPADDHGDAVSGYTLLVRHNGTTKQIPVSGTSQNVQVATSESDYVFAVIAHNKAGDSAASADSAPRRGATAPGAPTGVTLTPGDRSVKVAFVPGALNGNRAGEITYHYKVNQTGTQGTITSGGSIGGLTNGTSYTVNVWATSSVQGVTQSGQATSNAAVPFGKPIITLQGVDRQNNAVRFRWNVNANGSPLTAATPGQAGDNSEVVSGLKPGQSTTLNVSYTNAAGTSTASWSGQANDPPPPPPPTGTVSKGGSAEGQPLTDGTGKCGKLCYFVQLTTKDLPAGTYQVQCWSTHDSSGPWRDGQVTLNAGRTQLPCIFGFPGEKVWVVVVGKFTTAKVTW